MLFISLPPSCLAQTGNHTMFSDGLGYYFKNGNLMLSENHNTPSGLGHTISNYDGTLRLYADFGYISDGKDKILNPPKETAWPSCANKSIIVTINDSLYYVFYEFSDTSINYISQNKLYYETIIETNGALRQKQSKQLFYPARIKGMTVVEDTLGGSWLITRTSANTFVSYYFNDSCFGCRTAVSSVPFTLSKNWFFDIHCFLKRSPSGNRIAAFNNDLYDIVNGTESKQAAMALDFAFNKNNGQLVFNDTIIFYIDTIDINRSNRHSLAYSSDDKIIYFKYHGSDSVVIYKSQVQNLNSKIEILNYKYYSPFNSNLKGVSRDINLCNEGSLLYITAEFASANPDKTIHFHALENPNNWLSSTFNINKYSLNPSRQANLHWNSSYSKYNYIRTQPKITYDCAATVAFINNCDYALPNTLVNYFIEDTAGSGVLIAKGDNPTLIFTKNGDYLVKVVLKSDEGNYKEIHYDTLKIRIPPKPVANFLTKDTIVCRFAPLSFVNFSTAKDIHPTNPQKWVWTFGDGETITTNNNKSVTHTYKLPGLYTVSLFYSNGYCDSTLVRNQYIKVVDAPVPGFSVKDTIGCAPFVAQFTDTTYENITKKEYFFSDNNNWETITNQQFSHTFNQAGKFRAVQRLYGFSGCITQSDSVWFYVSAGLTTNDTLHANVASYLPNNNIELNWSALPAAVAYGVYKANNGTVFNSSPFTITTSTSIIDTPSTPSLVAYEIVGIDSCGSLSAAGRMAQPILLQGKVADKNTMAILTFTPYSQWHDTQINYQIEHFIDGNWMVLTSQTDTQQVIDHAFRQDGGVDKCYRVKATNKEFSSYSNNLCLPYLPMLFVPNAFSPNNDGINDVFKPITYGIVSYELKIYNRWGQQITLLHKDEAWEAKDIPQGAYYLQLSAIAVDGSQYFANEVIHLVR